VLTASTAARPSLPFLPPVHARVRLFCLPHAGAGATAYRAWASGLPPHIGACPIQPPGRETRLRERPFESVGPLVAELADELTGMLDRPYAVLGHSVGALVAFELLREIRARGGSAPVHLFVAGRPAPQLPYVHPELRGMTVDQLADLLSELGGTQPEVLGDRALLAAIAPVFRADFAVNETYRYRAQAPLDVPITALGATDDPRADRAQLTAWAAQTTREFRTHLLDGGHFAVLRQPHRVHAVLARALARWAAPDPDGGEWDGHPAGLR
jgi:medium-chain acyl-[acyl-carrier-protein] hydrolase